MSLGGSQTSPELLETPWTSTHFRSPRFGVGRRGSPRFVPICSAFPIFFRFVPICAPCFREYPDLFRFVPICSVFFRFVPICFQNKSEQIRETTFCRPLLQIPDMICGELPQKFPIGFCGASLTVDFKSKPRFRRSSRRLLRKFPAPPQIGPS